MAPPGTKFAVREIKLDIPVNDPPPPEHFLLAVKSFLKADLAEANAMSEGGADAWEIAVTVMTYRMRSGFNRFMFGMLAGKDGIDSQVQLLDPSGQVQGESKVSTFNVTAVGASEDVARMHADEIANFVLRNRAMIPAPPSAPEDSKYPKPRICPGDMNDTTNKK